MSDPALRLTRILERARDHAQRVLVLGIGNEMLGDDAVGVLIARDLAALNDERFTSVPVEIGVENAGHLVRRHRPHVLLIFDAVAATTRKPWLFVPTSRLDTWCHSTHSVPLGLLIRTWQLDAPRMRPYFVGVRPLLVALGAPLSPKVQAAREEIVALVHSAAAR
ncbi:MAG: hydrogenase maturation protease [Thermoanaerobaculaceae bacterium]|nr:hydrogenase maturation protease [Thermoanaerobaculaceae bacterium]MDI9621165.1 hydrogenase maturation protease [Acidobacteriota bacterium]NLH11259.1 hydrogenase maturation protease [Holophagae bacterium]HPW55662.1 hydrogenase maturation protease [Thermoanaerobaculaceae bacterium]